METQCSPFNFDFHFLHEEDEGMEDLWHSLINKTMELETRVTSAKEEITKKEDELTNLKHSLNRTIRERDEAESKCQTIMLDIVNLQKQQNQRQTNTNVVDRVVDQCVDFDQSGDLAGKAALPEKGKLLQAVMEAGPLLQTLLLAGPLPEWQRPPPRVDAVEIPPVKIGGFRNDIDDLGRKRKMFAYYEGYVFPSKCQKLALY